MDISSGSPFQRALKHVPEFIVGLSYYHCGVFLAYILYSFNLPSGEYFWIQRWPLIIAMFGCFATALTLGVLKRLDKRIVWLHFYLMAIGSVFLLSAGLLIMLNWEYRVSSMLGGLGYGIFYIAGLSYIHFRTNSHKHRVARIALCHLAMAIGMVSSVHHMSKIWSWWSTQFIFGYFLTYSSATILLLFLVNELLHGLGVYNYKQSLDPQLEAANQAKDLFKSALNPPQGIVITTRYTVRQAGLTIMMMFSKSLNGFFYNNIFMFITLVAQSSSIRYNGVFILHYFMLLGIILGIIISLTPTPGLKIHYPVTLLGALIVFVIAGTLWEVRNLEAAAWFFWIFYMIAAAGLFIPDVGIMEVSNPLNVEFTLCIGFILEQIPILISVYYVNEQWTMVIGESKMFWINAGVYMFLSALMAVAMFIYYPNTFQRKVLEIQQLILYNFVGALPTMPPNSQQLLVQHPTQHVTMIPQGTAMQYPPPNFDMTAVPPPAGSQAYYTTQPTYPGQPIYSQQPIYLAQHPGASTQPNVPVPMFAVHQNPAYYPLAVPPLDENATAKGAEAERSQDSAATAPELTPQTEHILAEQTMWQPSRPNQQAQPPAYQLS